MKKSTKTKIGIVGIASNLPRKVLTSTDVASFSRISEDYIFDKLGFKEKRVADTEEHPSTLALKATKKLLKDISFLPSRIDFIIYCSNGIYDYQFWSPSAFIQNKIKANKAITFEINNGCNAATAGMFMARSLLSNPSFKYGLVIVSDTLSKLVDYKDKNSFPLFSFADGATAVLLGKNLSSNIILSQSMHTDGSFSECNKLLSGGTMNIRNTNRNEKFIFVDYFGRKTAQLRNSAMANNYVNVILEAMKLAGKKVGDISYFLFNQNSLNILNKVKMELGIPENKLYSTRKYNGHIGAVDTLLALERCIRKGMVKRNDIVVLASVGIGYHWGAQVIRI